MKEIVVFLFLFLSAKESSCTAFTILMNIGLSYFHPRNVRPFSIID